MNTFFNAFFALYQVMTGEDWNAIMYNIMRVNPIFGIIFMCSFFILANYVLMEMFCAVKTPLLLSPPLTSSCLLSPALV